MLRFRSHGAFVDTWLGLAVSVSFLAAAVWVVLLEPGLQTGAVAVILGGAAAVFAIPAIYSAWGAVVIDRDNDKWVVCYQLRRWKRYVRFAVADTCSTERCVLNSRGFGTREGLHLLVHVAGRADPVRIGGGFHLEEAELRAIEALVAPGVNFR